SAGTEAPLKGPAMTLSSSVRRNISEVAARLAALREESVPAGEAVGMLVTEGVVAPQAAGDSGRPLAAAIHSVAPASAAVAGYLRASEASGGGDDTLRFLGQLAPRARSGRGSLSVINIEFSVLLVVVLTYSLFVLPQLQSAFQTFGTPLPRFTHLVFA